MFQLKATYKPNPSAEIVYGLNLKDILKMEKQESGEWGIYPNGTVVLVNSGAIDREVGTQTGLWSINSGAIDRELGT